MSIESVALSNEVLLNAEEIEQAEQLQTRFEVTWEEGQQFVEAGKYRGTLAQMLLDPECPVGAEVQLAYEQGFQEGRGKEAVQEKLDAFSLVFSNFKADVGERFDSKKKQNK